MTRKREYATCTVHVSVQYRVVPPRRRATPIWWHGTWTNLKDARAQATSQAQETRYAGCSVTGNQVDGYIYGWGNKVEEMHDHYRIGVYELVDGKPFIAGGIV